MITAEQARAMRKPIKDIMSKIEKAIFEAAPYSSRVLVSFNSELDNCLDEVRKELKENNYKTKVTCFSDKGKIIYWLTISWSDTNG